MKTVHILHTGSEIEIFYTLYPFIICNKSDLKFVFLKADENTIQTKKGDTVLFTRIFKKRYDDQDFVRSSIKRLKENFNRIYFLDDSAGADSTHFEFIDLLDGYYKTKLLNNDQLFSKEMYGRQIFSDYYHREFNVRDEALDIRPPLENPKMTEKLRPAFNLGYGLYPKPESRSLIRYTGSFFSKLNRLSFLKPFFLHRQNNLINSLSKKIEPHRKSLKISARFRYKEYPNSIGYQRHLFESIIDSHPGFCTGLVSKKEYEDELSNVIATLSPFGYGEVCFRDFESIINGSLLLKPDMSHLTTRPNIYIPNETYIPLRWDGSDLLDIADNILSKPELYYAIIDNARRVYRDSLRNLKAEFEETFKDLF